MLDFCIYLLYRAGTGLLRLVPLPLVFRGGEVGGLLAWFCSRKYRRLARRNLAIAFGDTKNERELRQLTRRHFQRLGANLLSSAKIGTMSLDQVAGCVTLEGEDALHRELRTGRGVVLVSSHLGSWELFAQVLPRYFGYVRISTVFQALGNRFIDADVRRLRARSGLELFDRREGFHAPIELLRGGGIVGILADQHAGDNGLWTPFFGRLASTTPLPALLAKRTRTAVISTAIHTTSPGRWRMVFTPSLDAPDDSVSTLTAKANRVITDQIRQSPEDWFWVHNRWKTPRPNFLLPKYKRGVYLGAGYNGAGPPPGRTLKSDQTSLRPEGGPAPLKPFRILIRSPNWLGDSVISAAAVRAIKRGRPDAHITIAAPAKIAPVWKMVPEVDEILPLPSRSLSSTASLLRKQPAFDVAILFPNSLRSALEVWLAGIPRRVGYRGHSRTWLLNQIVPEPKWRGPIRHQVHHYLHLAEAVGADLTIVPDTAAPRAISASSPIKIGLCPGAEYGPTKRWLPERFAEAAAAVSAQRPVQWILFGTAAEVEIGKPIADVLGDLCVNRIGHTTLEELIAELRECRLLLTNDTGTMHLATLLGVPVVAIFGSTENRLTGPLGEGHTVVRHHVACSPCFLRQCPIDFRCMNSVTSEEVAATVLTKL